MTDNSHDIGDHNAVVTPESSCRREFLKKGAAAGALAAGSPLEGDIRRDSDEHF